MTNSILFIMIELTVMARFFSLKMNAKINKNNGVNSNVDFMKIENKRHTVTNAVEGGDGFCTHFIRLKKTRDSERITSVSSPMRFIK